MDKFTFSGLWEWIEENAIQNKEIAKEVKLHMSLEMTRRGYAVKLYQIYEAKGEIRLHLFSFYETDTFDRMEALEQVATKIQEE